MNRFAKKRIFNAKASARGGKRSDLGDLYVRSTWEANCARVLTEMKNRGEIVSWEYEPVEFTFPVKRGTRFYRPDFAVHYDCSGPPIYWEVKGLMGRKDITSLTRMAKYYPNVTVLIVGKKEYAEFESQYGTLDYWER